MGERSIFINFIGINIALWTICDFLPGTYPWNRSLFIMPSMQRWNCPGCGDRDTRMNGQSVSEIWPRMISHMNLPFSKENHARLTADILLNSCCCPHLPCITCELFCEIIEKEELWIRELKIRSVCSGLTMAFCAVVDKV